MATGVTRKNSTHLRVPCLPHERQTILHNASTAGMSTAAFLRAVGMGSEVRSVVDFERLQEVTRIAADLGRLGGLLKLWLTRPEKLKPFGEARVRDAIEGALDEVLVSQKALREAVDRMLKG